MNDQEMTAGQTVAQALGQTAALAPGRNRLQLAMDKLNSMGEYSLEEQLKAMVQNIIEKVKQNHGRAYQLASDERIKMGCVRLLMNLEDGAPYDSELSHASRPMNPETILALQAILGTDDVK